METAGGDWQPHCLLHVVLVAEQAGCITGEGVREDTLQGNAQVAAEGSAWMVEALFHRLYIDAGCWQGVPDNCQVSGRSEALEVGGYGGAIAGPGEPHLT